MKQWSILTGSVVIPDVGSWLMEVGWRVPFPIFRNEPLPMPTGKLRQRRFMVSHLYVGTSSCSRCKLGLRRDFLAIMTLQEPLLVWQVRCSCRDGSVFFAGASRCYIRPNVESVL
ncbi:hypothetical protein J6590_014982 [Homalodisca vitripennis]|nr:hypothetical protein J6590_014982 [Homalodisca vitripennis]